AADRVAEGPVVVDADCTRGVFRIRCAVQGEFLRGEAIADAGAEEFGQGEEAEYSVLALRDAWWYCEEEQEGEKSWSHDRRSARPGTGVPDALWAVWHEPRKQVNATNGSHSTPLIINQPLYFSRTSTNLRTTLKGSCARTKPNDDLQRWSKPRAPSAHSSKNSSVCFSGSASKRIPPPLRFRTRIKARKAASVS